MRLTVLSQKGSEPRPFVTYNPAAETFTTRPRDLSLTEDLCSAYLKSPLWSKGRGVVRSFTPHVCAPREDREEEPRVSMDGSAGNLIGTAGDHASQRNPDPVACRSPSTTLAPDGPRACVDAPHPSAKINKKLHDAAYARLGGAPAERSNSAVSLLSEAGTPCAAGTQSKFLSPTRSSFNQNMMKHCADASDPTIQNFEPEPVPEKAAEQQVEKRDETGALELRSAERMDSIDASLDLGQLLRLACARAVRVVEMQERMLFEDSCCGSAKGLVSRRQAFEDHLDICEPTRRSRLVRNNGCLDLGALHKRARSARLEQACE
jgi:hypothetical protein